MKKPKGPQPYDHTSIEKNWQKKWQTEKTYKTEANSKKKKMYVLDMFPYPSGAGLHVGHPRGYIGSDVYARMKRMQGFNVLHPMGYDAFGLPAEQYAIANKVHPRKAVDANVKTFEKQMSIIGLSYDWSRKVNTTDPEYYKWTQWIFLQIYNAWYDNTKQKARPISELISIFEKKGNAGVDAACDAKMTSVFSAKEWKSFSALQKNNILMQYRLSYEGYSEVNWCPEMGTVLANDEIVDGPNGPVSERGGYPVVKKSMRQWFMRITAYAERLLQDLDGLDWSEHLKEIQRNWIGRSEGSLIPFQIKADKNHPKQILVGTRNEAKVKMLRECFPKDSGIELISLNDIPPVDDSHLIEGQDFLENAKMKSEFYFKKTGIPTLSTDNVFWVEKWPKDNQIVIHMRKEAGNGNDKTSDEDVIAFFQKWLKKVGDSKARFIFGLAYTDENGTKTTSSAQREYKFQSKRIKGSFWQGYPTECLLVDAGTGVCKGNQTVSERYNVFMSCLKNEVLPWIKLSESIDVFTTRADTLFGVTYVSIAPESELVSKLQPHVLNWKEVEKYIEDVAKKTPEERTNAEKEKTGVRLLGVFAINPANGEKVPVWVADYVLAGYGTGAVMAVPAHDERDYAFAKKFNLPVKAVVEEKFWEDRGGEDGIRPNEPFIKRTAAAAIIRNPKDNTYLTTDWKNFVMHGLVTGGVEDGEDLVEAAKREIQEETGYKNLKLVRNPNIVLNSFFYHRVKKQNRHAKFCFLVFDLVDESRDPIDEKEAAIHNVVWKTLPELEKNYFTVIEGIRALDLIKNPDYIFTNDGLLVDSGKFDGLNSDEARVKITEAVGGKLVTKFKMRDAIFARQRYWGEPIPLKRGDDGITVPLKEKELPLKLPNVTSYEPSGNGESPLAGVKAWVKGGYETNTMPGWAGSSWYFLRYTDPNNKSAFASKKSVDYWFGKKDGGVDMYVGGAEHATGHLLYSRFWHKFLFDMGYVPSKEPFKALRNQGMIGGADGRKMSKRWGNVVNPDDVIKTYGADSLRVFEMFLGPFDSHLPWSTEGIIGSRRFIEKVWRMQYKVSEKGKTSEEAEKVLHKTIKKVGDDIAGFNFNTAISAKMICVNEMEKSETIALKDFKMFLQILAPFASHVTEDLWRTFGERKSIHISGWPKFDPKKLVSDTVKIVVQINGKIRGEFTIAKDLTEEQVKMFVLNEKVIIPWIENKEIKRFIYVPGRLVNIVV